MADRVEGMEAKVAEAEAKVATAKEEVAAAEAKIAAAQNTEEENRAKKQWDLAIQRLEDAQKLHSSKVNNLVSLEEMLRNSRQEQHSTVNDGQGAALANAISNTPDWQDLLAFVRTKKAEEETLIISEPKTKLFESVLDELNLKMDAARWSDKPNFDPPGAPYTWRNSKEDSQENRAAYMSYLRDPDNIVWPQETQLFEGSLDKGLLTVKVLGFDSIKTSGNIDVVLASSHHQSIVTVRQNILMGIELKKDTNRDSSKIERQVTLQHISASYLNADTGVLTMMTDLHDRWIFFWFAEGNRLIRYEASRPEAMFLIQHSQDDDDERQTTFPTSFLDRACWNDLFSPQLDSIVEVKSFDEKEGEGAHPQQGSGGSGGGKSLVEAGDQSVSQQVTSHGTGSASHHHGKSHRYNRNGKKHVQIGDASLEYMDEEERFEAIVRTAFHKMLHIPKVEGGQDVDNLPREIVWGDSKMA